MKNSPKRIIRRTSTASTSPCARFKICSASLRSFAFDTPYESVTIEIHLTCELKRYSCI